MVASLALGGTAHAQEAPVQVRHMVVGSESLLRTYHDIDGNFLLEHKATGEQVAISNGSVLHYSTDGWGYVVDEDGNAQWCKYILRTSLWSHSNGTFVVTRHFEDGIERRTSELLSTLQNSSEDKVGVLE